VHWWVFEANNAHAELARSAGFVPGRHLLQMRRPLPLDAGLGETLGGLEVEPFVPGRDEEEWLAVNNAAFASHPEQGDWTLDTIRARETEPWFNPTGFLLHRTQGRIDGFCWMKMHHDHGKDKGEDNSTVTGEIYVIGVAPSAASRGLGRRLAVAGLEHATRAGAHTAMLYVDSDNTAAVAMYTALGFSTHHTERAFVGDVAPR
jgi:mycothiol synthase